MSDEIEPPMMALRAAWAALVANAVVLVIVTLDGDWKAALGYLSAVIACFGWITCAERWRTWRHVADMRRGDP